MNVKVCEFIGFCQIFFRNDFTVRLKRSELNWVSPVCTLADIEKSEIYKVYKGYFVKSCGICLNDNVLNIYITC